MTFTEAGADSVLEIPKKLQNMVRRFGSEVTRLSLLGWTKLHAKPSCSD